MAQLFIYRFQYGRTLYNIFADSETGEASYSTIAVSYSANTRPYGGTILGGFCIGFDRYDYYASANVDTPGPTISEPYSNTIVTPNSSVCGYNGGGDNLDLEFVSVTNESAYLAKDGKVLISITGGTEPYLYTLDGSNYSVFYGDEITDLAPGDYTILVEDSNGLQMQGEFTIEPFPPIMGCTDRNATNYNPNAQVDDGSCTYPNPENPDDPDTRQNIYETVDQFRLINKAGDIFLIDMPRGWENIVFKLERDKQYHGVNYDFSDGEVQLDFDVAAGKDILQAEYNANGNDGYMAFQFGEVFPDGTFNVDVDAYVDFNTKTNDRDFFSASVKRKTFNDAIETKNEVDVTLSDGYFTMPLHSKLIRKQTTINKGYIKSPHQPLIKNEITGSNPNNPGAPGDSPFLVYWSFLDFSEPTNTTGTDTYIDNLCQDASSLFGVTSSNPITNHLRLFKADGAGTFDFQIDFSCLLDMQLNGSSRIGYFSYKWFLCVNSTTKYELPGTNETGFVSSDGSLIGLYNTSFAKTITVNQDDEVFLFGQFVCESRGGLNSSAYATITLYSMNVNIVGGSLARPTNTQAKLAFEVGQGILDNITGGTAKLVSNLLGRTDIGYEENGCAALIAYTNGYLIRNFAIADHPIIIQLKDFIEGLDANFAIGMGYELDSLNNWVYRLEQFEYFYQDALIMTFDNVDDYQESVNTDMIYNQYEFGYDKYTQNLESAETLDEFLTDHTYLSPIESFKATLTKICKQIFAGYAIELTRRVQFSTDPVTSWTYDEDNFCIGVVPDAQYGYRPEKLENFTASGIISPETAYNIRFTITRMLARWAKWINSGIAYKTNSAVIKNTYVSKNGDLVSQYTGDSPCESKVQFTESHDILKGDLANGTQKFRPEEISFKTRLSWEQIRAIKRCFSNKDTTGKNNGYFGVIDGDGNTQYGYLMTMEYNGVNEQSTFVLRKKYVNLNEPFDCSTYHDYTFEMFESATGLPTEIEQCLFQDFA